jgi:peptide deformylase
MSELVEQLHSLGIRQEGDPILRGACHPFDLPRERSAAVDLGHKLVGYIEPLQAIHPFTKGIGLAAPQIGVSRAMSVIRSQGGEPFLLMNPRITWRSEEEDVQYEGCLSFFDVRVPVPRALAITVETSTLDGGREQRRFELGLARLVAHEIDHLNGKLARDLVPAGAKVLPLSEYRQGDRAWQY